MHQSIPGFLPSSRFLIALLSLLIAVAVVFLPAAAARIKIGNPAGPLTPGSHEKLALSENLKPANWQVSNASASDSPVGPEASFVVNNNGDAADTDVGNGVCDTSAAAGDQCTLRAAIQEANAVFGSDTITFGLASGTTITLNTVLPDIAGDLTINGPGSGLLTIRRSSAGGTPNFRIFKINYGQISISGLKVTNGRTADGIPGGGGSGYGGPGDHGGGIFNGGALTLTDVVVMGNRTGNGGAGTSGSGGPGGFGGGIYVSGSGALTMTNVTVSNNTTGNGAVGYYGGSGGRGGGIYFMGSTLTLTTCVVSGNTAGNGVSGTSGGSSGSGGDGGGIEAQSAFGSPSSTLILTNVVINGNHAGNGAQPIGSTGGHGGGILTSPGVTTTMTNCTVSNNNSGQGGTGFSSQGGLGGGIINLGEITMSGCTVNGNFTKGPSQGGGASGGGIFNNNILRMTNTTVSGNRTDLNVGRGGGIYNNGGTITLTNSTVTGNLVNTSFEGGRGIHSSGTANIRNTIIAGNGSGGPDVTGSYTSRGNNLIGAKDSDSSGFTNGSNGDQVGTVASPLNALLGPLANNGGPTMTRALLDSSPALDAGANCVTEAAHCGDANIPQLATDQRGAGFNRIVDGPDANTTATVDIGAYERQATFPDLADTSGNEDTTVVVAFEVLDSASITSVTATSSNTTLVPNNPANISVSGSGSNRVVTINPTANLSGTSVITVTVNRTSGSASTTFTLTINEVNDAPSFTKGPDQTVNENAGAQSVSNWATSISAGPPDESAQTLSFQVTDNTNAALFSVGPAISPSGTLTYTPAAGVSGLATISVALKDNGGTTNGGVDTSATQTFEITVLEGGTLEFSQTYGYTAFEGNPGIVITVVRNNGSAGEALVDYATNETTLTPATAGVDYTATSGTLTFADGVTSQTFTVPLTNDTIDEPQESIGLKLTNARGSASLSSGSETFIIIIDDEPPPNLGVNDVSVTEGQSGTVNAVFTVTLSAPSAFTVSANYATADNSASSASDYQAASGQITLNPGELTKTISVTVNGDTVPEVHESFFVNLSNATSSFLSDSHGVGTILSDDAPGGTLAFNVLHDNVNENSGFKTIVVNRSGNISAAVTVNYATSDGNASLVPCSTSSGNASARCDFTTALGTLRFAAGDASESFIVLINQDNFVEGPEILTLTLSNPGGGAVFGTSAPTVSGSLTIADDVTEPATNPIDDADAFVRQHYHDFLNREADASGLAFWKDEILSCGVNPQCIELKRINVSAAFYLSIEFQETGYLVERMYKVSYGHALGTSTLGGLHQFPVPVIRLNEFLPDTQEIGLGVVVGQPGWQEALDNNKQLFADRFVQRARFTAANAFPTTMTASEFVDKLNTNAGGVLLPAERIDLINQLDSGAQTRAQVMRTIAEDSDLVIAERNRAFVLMQYFGYLRRNPNDSPDADHTGYEYWLNKLNQFGGNFVEAELVKAFISATEYRQRFGQ